MEPRNVECYFGQVASVEPDAQKSRRQFALRAAELGVVEKPFVPSMHCAYVLAWPVQALLSRLPTAEAKAKKITAT